MLWYLRWWFDNKNWCAIYKLGVDLTNSKIPTDTLSLYYVFIQINNL